MMLPHLCFNFDSLLVRRMKKKEERSSGRCAITSSSRNFPRELKALDLPNQTTNSCTTKLDKHKKFYVWPRRRCREEEEEEEERKRREMANYNKLSHPDDQSEEDELGGEEEEEEEQVTWSGEEDDKHQSLERVVRQMEGVTLIMADVFQAVSAVKRAYVTLQNAHNPWDPHRIRIADAAVVAELRKLAMLRDRFTRRGGRGFAHAAATRVAPAPLREAVVPYEAALEELKRELRAKEGELESLKEKLMLRSTTTTARRRLLSSKRVGCSTGLTAAAPTAPTSELFEACMEQVRLASKSFTDHLLSLMRTAGWDIAAAVRSMLEGGSGTDAAVELHHAKHALESYVSRKMFHGFENESFYLEGSLASLLHPAQHRRDSLAQFRDMRGMDPSELLGVLPTCQLGRFAANKYLALVHAKMEESLFGGVEQRRQVLAGTHPRTPFYGDHFLRLAKAVWLLHLLAFSLEPSPSHFEASSGAHFHPDYMESVVRFAGGRVPPGWVVGFSVGPGFKLGNGAVVKARVYLVPQLE